MLPLLFKLVIIYKIQKDKKWSGKNENNGILSCSWDTIKQNDVVYVDVVCDPVSRADGKIIFAVYRDGKKVGETFKLEGVPLTYRVDRIIPNGTQPKASPSTEPSKISQPVKNTTSLKSYFQNKGFKVVDCRTSGGCLWVIGEKKELEPYVLEAARLFRANGAYGSGKATSYKSGWWTKSDK